MTKEIICKHGEIALCDDEDYPLLVRHSWQFQSGKEKPYVVTAVFDSEKKQRNITMHNLILGMTTRVDHIDNDGLNNCKDNLRKATYQQNGWNKGKPKANRHGANSSQYKGVSKNKTTGLFHVIIKTTARGVKPAQYIRLGPFKYEDDAARAYNKAIVEVRGEWGWVNPLPEDKINQQT